MRRQGRSEGMIIMKQGSERQKMTTDVSFEFLKIIGSGKNRNRKQSRIAKRTLTIKFTVASNPTVKQ